MTDNLIARKTFFVFVSSNRWQLSVFSKMTASDRPGGAALTAGLC